ncbi:MAG: hypothetical protein ACOC2N_07095 [Spirochaetota bacterium]
MRAVAQADFVVYAGYENMVERLLATIGDSQGEAIRIVTVHSERVLRESVNAIASSLGTEDVAERRLDELLAVLEQWREEVREYGAANAVRHLRAEPHRSRDSRSRSGLMVDPPDGVRRPGTSLVSRTTAE